MSLLLTATRRLLFLRTRSTISEKSLMKAIAKRGGAAPVTRAVKRVAHVNEVLVDGRRVIRLTPRGRATGNHLIYTHGGCYTFPLIGAHWGILASLVARSGVSVDVPLYGLAPQHTATEAYDWLEKVYDEALDEFGPRVFLAGDSAGGGLALGQALRYRDTGRPAPLGVLLISPWVDVTLTNPGAAAIAPLDHMLASPGLVAAGRLWAGDLDPRDPLVSPLYADLSGLPPVHTYQGDHDILYADAEELTRRILRAGGLSELRVTRGGFHVFPGAPWIPEARVALTRMARVLRRS
jgi:monoterpene epsilon-lactone hydrolase